MRTAYKLWAKPASAHGYGRHGDQYDTLGEAMAAAGYPDEGDWRWANSDEVNRVPTDAAVVRTGDTISWLLTPERVAENDGDRIELAVEVGLDFGNYDGAHHKMWVIDQMLRALTGDRYEAVIDEWCAGEDGPETYSWDEGIAP